MANEYWVEYNYSTHECSIVEKKVAAERNGRCTKRSWPPLADVTASGTPKTVPYPTFHRASPLQRKTCHRSLPPARPMMRTRPVSHRALPRRQTPQQRSTRLVRRTALQRRARQQTRAAPTAKMIRLLRWRPRGSERRPPQKPLEQRMSTTVEIGTAMHSREDAEAEMQVMRKCGLKN